MLSVALTHLRRKELAALSVSVTAGVATISGRISSYYLRQTAIETVRRVHGIAQIVDQLETVATAGGC